MTWLAIIWMVLAGFVAGAINAVAGGGSFFTFAALVASGLSTLDANATSSVALSPANLASAAGYRTEIRAHFRDMVGFAFLAVIGAAFGALVLIWIGDEGFRPTVPWLLLLATLLFAFSGQIRRLFEKPAEQRGRGTRLAALGLMLTVALYGGFFGAGMGIMMLAVLSIVESGDFHKLNATKNLQSFLIQTISGAVLIAGGLVHWPQALITMAASSLGAYTGVWVARKVPQRIIRIFVVSVGAILTVIFFLK